MKLYGRRHSDHPPPGLARVVERNIAALLERRRQAEAARTASERIADTITAFTGSMLCVYLHLVIFGAWIVINLGWVPGVPRFDPTFVMLAMVASVEAIFLSTFVLITQNRMAEAADRRADLDLQISLLAEHEVTRLIALTSDIAARLGVPIDEAPELEELKQDIRPEQVLAEIEENERRLEAP